jgi:5-formyltetrahydrofolate cyclo-ligase
VSTDDKAILRREIREWRARLDADTRSARFDLAVRGLALSPVWSRGSVVALYVAMSDEPDLTPLFVDAAASGRTVALPVVVRRGEPLQWRQYEPGDSLKTSRFGVSEPIATAPVVAPETIDLVIVPALAVDDRGVRLGYGGGYYDRTLRLMPHAVRAWVGLREQRIPQVPRGDHDEPVDWLFDDEGPTEALPSPRARG